jgi:hypothetical protein
MDEAQVIERMPLITDDQTPKIAQPGEKAFNLPTPPIASEWTPILRSGTDTSAAMGRDHLDAQVSQLCIQRIGIIGFVADQPLREVADEAGVEGGSDEGNLARRSRGGTSGERKTKTVCHCHELRTFAPLGRSHTPAPFLATTKVPSIKHSERSSLPRSFRSRASASKMRSYVLSCTHRWNRRWQVWYGGYRSGRSAHWAPVLRIHRIPFNTSRLLRQGRPRPSARRGMVPSTGSNAAHCSSVNSIAASSSWTQRITHL